MKAFVAVFKRIDWWMNSLAEIALVFMMMLTVADVILRIFGATPIIGTYELVAITGAVVTGFAIPQTSWDRGHVFVDFLLENRTPVVKNGFFIATRIIGIILFALLSWNLYKKGMHLYKSGEVSMTLHFPYFPSAFALSFCSLIESFTLITDIFKLFIGEEKK